MLRPARCPKAKVGQRQGMNRARSFVLLAGLSPWVAACRDTPQAKAKEAQAVEAARKQELARRLAAADANPEKPAAVAEWLMPPELREISGLTLTARGTVLTHDDNVARMYEIDPKTGILLKGFSLEGGVRGDFEAITIAGTDIYLLESKGKFYRFKEGADAAQVPYALYDTKLGKECEFESLVYEADSTRLVMACKKIRGKNAPHEVLIYRFPMPLDRCDHVHADRSNRRHHRLEQVEGFPCLRTSPSIRSRRITS